MSTYLPILVLIIKTLASICNNKKLSKIIASLVVSLLTEMLGAW